MFISLVSCSGSHTDEPMAPVVPVTPPEVPAAADMPMAFIPASSATSRTPMQKEYTLFKIWSYKHTSPTTTENVMPGYQVKYLDDIDGWQYDGTKYTSVAELANPVEGHDRQYLKYWDASALSYHFYGIVPTTLAGVTCDEGGIKISNVTGHTPTTTGSEILMAKHRRDISGTLADADELDASYTFQPLAQYYDNVPLRFHHLFSRVTFKIYNCGSLPAELKRASVTLNHGETIITKGNYVGDHWESTGAADATNVALMEFERSTPLVLKVNGTIDDAETLTSMFELSQPVTLTDASTITVKLTINNTLYESQLSLPNETWDFDKDYIYYLKIQVGEGSPILIYLSVDKFTHSTDVDDTQTNW